jgi:hypothetical protein
MHGDIDQMIASPASTTLGGGFMIRLMISYLVGQVIAEHQKIHRLLFGPASEISSSA